MEIDVHQITNHPISTGEFVPKLEPKSDNHIPHSILILGNGFDLDLGIQTKYQHFAENKHFWPFKDSFYFEEDSLPFYLNTHKNNVDTWFDLEELLACFANESKSLSKEKIAQVKRDFYFLSEALKNYLINQENIFVEKMKEPLDSTRGVKPAHLILQLFCTKKVRTIYTFNYTNAYRIANQFISNFDDEIHHVHGSTSADNIILGTGDQRQIQDNFFEFYKSASPFYKSNNLVEDLNNADEVYIFGHSLGKNDHDYFSEFFKMASKTVHRPFAPGKIKIRLFTFNQNSEIELKKQLMTLTENHLIGLYAHCDFKILKTDTKYQDWMVQDDVF